MKYREIIKRIQSDGWYLKRVNGSHYIYKHPIKPETVVVAYHGTGDIPEGTLKNILKRAGLE